MFTNYGPYDLHQVELIKQDKQRALQALYVPATFEGVSVTVGDGRRLGASRSFLRRALASLCRMFGSAAQPLRHLTGRI